MTDHQQTIHLPPSVEQLLTLITNEKSTPPADYIARVRLSNLGENASLTVLNDIRRWNTVKNLSASIVAKAKKVAVSTLLPSTPPPPATPPTSIDTYNGGYSTLSPHTPAASPASVSNSPSTGNSSGENKRKRGLDYPDEVVNARQVLSVRFPPLLEEVPDVSASNKSVFDVFEEFEFKKAFLILSYTGRSKLESVFFSDKIQLYRELPMNHFVYLIRHDFGLFNCNESQKKKVVNWEIEETWNFHCHVDGAGSCSFKVPTLSKETTLLQKTAGETNVLIVKFMEDSRDAPNKLFEDGIVLGERCFRFFAFKDGGNEEKKKDQSCSPVKCYFVCLEGFAHVLGIRKDMSVQEARSIFMHIHKAPSLSNYMARFSLILSKTTTMEQNWKDITVKVIPDEKCRDQYGKILYDKEDKALILTDGTGYISEDLALMCPQNCNNGHVIWEENDQGCFDSSELPQCFSKLNEFKSHSGVPPLLIQFRMFYKGQAIKGTVLVNKKLPPKTIHVRDSMLKVAKDDELQGLLTKDSFEIVATSNKPNGASLSKNLIALLHCGGVPRDCFLKFLTDALERPLALLHKTKAALKAAVSLDFADGLLAGRMIASGVPLEEPFLRRRLCDFAKMEMNSLRAGKLPVNDSFYLMGTADPTMTLNPGEVCVILEDGQLTGPALVYRNPGLHPGDIHVVQAVRVEAMEDIVGKSKYGIFFPCKGQRSMADEIAGGDYDGDMYWVSTNSELLKYFKPSEPWVCMSTCPKASNIIQPSKLPAKKLELELFRLATTKSRPSKAMGVAANSWTVYMDRLLTLRDDCRDEKDVLMKKINELIDVYYDALDAPKKGRKVEVLKSLIPDKYPHHMERGEQCTYRSSSVLGEIYDIVEGFEVPIEIWKMDCFSTEVPNTLHYNCWVNHYNEYRAQMGDAVNRGSDKGAFAAIFQHYRKLLYGGVEELERSEKPWEEIRSEAIAIYHICYNYAKSVNDPAKCCFAWKVAGDSLIEIYKLTTSEKHVSFAPSVLEQMMR